MKKWPDDLIRETFIVVFPLVAGHVYGNIIVGSLLRGLSQRIWHHGVLANAWIPDPIATLLRQQGFHRADKATAGRLTSERAILQAQGKWEAIRDYDQAL